MIGLNSLNSALYDRPPSSRSVTNLNQRFTPQKEIFRPHEWIKTSACIEEKPFHYLYGEIVLMTNTYAHCKTRQRSETNMSSDRTPPSGRFNEQTKHAAPVVLADVGCPVSRDARFLVFVCLLGNNGYPSTTRASSPFLTCPVGFVASFDLYIFLPGDSRRGRARIPAKPDVP